MSDAQLRNLLVYAGLAVAQILLTAIAAALPGGTLPGFRDGEALAPARDQLSALLVVIGPIITTAVAAARTRIGSEGLAAQVQAKRRRGYHRDQLRVVTPDEIDAMTAPQPAPAVATARAGMTGVEMDRLAGRVADEMERRARAAIQPTRVPETGTPPPATVRRTKPVSGGVTTAGPQANVTMAPPENITLKIEGP